MMIDEKHVELRTLSIDRSQRAGDGGHSRKWWLRRNTIAGVVLVVLAELMVFAYRAFSSNIPEVVVVRASAENNGGAESTVLSATGYIVAHHTINVNSKVTGRVAWIGVENGDKVGIDQVLVRLEDQEFRASYEQAKGVVESARAYLEELLHGSRPEEIQQAQNNLDEARATLRNDQVTFNRIRELASSGVVSRQQLDDSTSKYEADKQHVNSLERAFELVKIGPRPEEIARARGALQQAQGMEDYARSQLEATVIRAPVAGTILDRTAEKGELITAQFASAAAGGPRGSVVTLADLSDLQVELDIAQADFARLGLSQDVIVSTDAYPAKTYEGVIAQISPEADRQKAAVQVKVKVLEPGKYPGIQLRPQMNATVKFLANGQPKTVEASAGVFVPSSAIHDRNGKKIVLIAFNGNAVAREVQILSLRSGGAQVFGLVGGELIVTSAPAALKDGDHISVRGQK